MHTEISSEKFINLYNDNKLQLQSFIKKIVKCDTKTEDVLQDVFRKLHKQNFDNIKGHVRQWLFTVSRNQAIKVYHKYKRLVPLNEELDSQKVDDSSDACESLMEKELKAKIPYLLNTLSEKQRNVVVLRFYHDMTYDQIAKKLHTSNGNVGFLLSTAMANLKKEFSNINAKYQYV